MTVLHDSPALDFILGKNEQSAPLGDRCTTETRRRPSHRTPTPGERKLCTAITNIIDGYSSSMADGICSRKDSSSRYCCSLQRSAFCSAAFNSLTKFARSLTRSLTRSHTNQPKSSQCLPQGKKCCGAGAYEGKS